MSQRVVPRRLRLACDRCNSLKLRCPKVQGSESCARCLKASASCVFSVSLRGLRPQPSGPASRSITGTYNLGSCNLQTAAETDTIQDTCWNTDTHNLTPQFNIDPGSDSFCLENGEFDFSESPLQSAYLSDGQHGGYDNQGAIPTHRVSGYSNPEETVMNVMAAENGGITNTGAAPGPVSSAYINPNSLIEHQEADVELASGSPGLSQLAELVIGLGELASSIPPLSIHDFIEAEAQSPASGDRSGSRGEGASPRTWFSLVRAFQHTQTLIDLYPRLQTTSIQNQLPLGDFPSFSLSPRQLIDNGPSRDASSLDHASIHLLFSCHHRIIDVWALIFGHVQKGVVSGKCLSGNSGRPSPCERLRIGSFAPSTKIPLELLLAIEYQTQLLDKIRELVDQIALPSRSVHHGGAWRLSDDTSETDVRDANVEATKNAGIALIGRASLLLEQAASVRHIILQRADKDS